MLMRRCEECLPNEEYKLIHHFPFMKDGKDVVGDVTPSATMGITFSENGAYILGKQGYELQYINKFSRDNCNIFEFDFMPVGMQNIASSSVNGYLLSWVAYKENYYIGLCIDHTTRKYTFHMQNGESSFFKVDLFDNVDNQWFHIKFWAMTNRQRFDLNEVTLFDEQNKLEFLTDTNLFYIGGNRMQTPIRGWNGYIRDLKIYTIQSNIQGMLIIDANY